MKKMLLSGMLALITTLSLLAQNPERKPITSAERATTTVSDLSHNVTFTDKQRSDVIAIYTNFYDDAHAQQAFRDPSKLAPLEKTRDTKVEKALNNPKLFKQYQEAVKLYKERMQERQEHQHQH